MTAAVVSRVCGQLEHGQTPGETSSLRQVTTAAADRVLVGPMPPASRKFVMVVYRNTDRKVDADGRPYGETGGQEDVQREADGKWWRIALSRRDDLMGIVYVVDGVVTRIRAVDPHGAWAAHPRDPRYVAVPVTGPLSPEQARERLPGLTLELGDPRHPIRGRIREYLPLSIHAADHQRLLLPYTSPDPGPQN